MKKTILILGILAVAFAGESFAQIVTPSLDPSLPVESPSAVSWRIGSSFGGSTAFNKDTSDTATQDYYSSETSVLLAYQPGTFVSEFYWLPSNSRYLWDASTDALTASTYTTGNFKLALRGENRVSVGIGYNTGHRTEPVLGSLTRVNNTSYEGSFSMRLLNRYFVAAGLRRNSDSYPGGKKIKSNLLLGGVAAQFGDPLGTNFRTELSMITKPRAENSDLPNVFQPKSTVTNIAVEFSFQTFILSYQHRNTTLESFNLAGQNKLILGKRYGVAYKLGSFVLGLYGTRSTESVDTSSFQSDKISASFSYGFI